MKTEYRERAEQEAQFLVRLFSYPKIRRLRASAKLRQIGGDAYGCMPG